MDPKYYTPEIEEFHVGFEYEYLDGLGTSSGWTKAEVDLSFLSHLEGSVGRGDDFRVKCLDREDIENLGWYYKSTTDVGLDYFWDVDKSEHSIIYDYKKQRAVVTVRDSNRKEDYSAFVGTIRNKSELIKLMKQLNIIK